MADLRPLPQAWRTTAIAKADDLSWLPVIGSTGSCGTTQGSGAKQGRRAA